MRYLYKRGGKRRVMHLCGYDSRTGNPSMVPLCSVRLAFDTTCNLPLGKPVCKVCAKKAAMWR